MPLDVDVYWSFRSPYSYLATGRLVALTTRFDVDVRVRIVLPIAIRVPGFFEQVNPLWPPYLLRDTMRIAEQLGIPFAWPSPDPVVQEWPSRRVAAEQPYIHRLVRLGALAARRGRGLAFVDEVSRLIWGGTAAWNEGSHLAEAAARAGCDLAEMDVAIERDATALDDEIEANQRDLEAAGHWGVPTMVFQGEPFFGQDRIDLLVWRLRQHGLREAAEPRFRAPRDPVLVPGPMSDGRYRESEALLARARRVVPGGIYGHQAPHQLVPGAYPWFFTRGDGARLWDVDGHEYVDLVCSYGPIVLGHNHPVVDEAARRQAAHGRCFNGPSPVMVELAERLVALTPWSAWAVFAKNGSDVCTWAVNVARHATGRRKVLVAEGSYHGGHAWCAPVTNGTTTEDRAHVVPFRYNDLASVDAALAAHEDDVAAIMVTPFRHDTYRDQELPAPDFLPGLRARCDRRGACLIMDDVRAGFRLHLGGSGERFGVQPDLACYSKAIANGYPLSACLGRDPLRDAAKRVFFVGTYWTAAVPMAAALACIAELERSDAIEHMERMGMLLRLGMERQAAAHGLAVRCSGPPAIPFMTFVDDEGFAQSRTFAAACAAHGVYLHPHHNWFLSAAHGEGEIGRVLEATEAAFREVAEAR